MFTYQNSIIFHRTSTEPDQPLSHKMTLKHIQSQKCQSFDGAVVS